MKAVLLTILFVQIARPGAKKLSSNKNRVQQEYEVEHTVAQGMSTVFDCPFCREHILAVYSDISPCLSRVKGQVSATSRKRAAEALTQVFVVCSSLSSCKTVDCVLTSWKEMGDKTRW